MQAKLTMLQLNYNSFSFCNPNKHELIETDTDCLYMALSEENLEKISRPEMQFLRHWMMQSDSSDNFASKSSRKFSHEKVAISMLLLTRDYLDFLKNFLEGDTFKFRCTYKSLSIKFTIFFIMLKTIRINFFYFEKNIVLLK